MFLDTISLNLPAQSKTETHKSPEFPFSLMWCNELGHTSLRLEKAVTVICGENGSGKSSFLELLASIVALPSIGSSDANSDATLAYLEPLRPFLKLSWKKKTKKGFYFRAEDYFGFVKKIDIDREQYKQKIKEVENDASLSPAAKAGALLPLKSSFSSYVHLYGESGLDTLSHGESFLRLFGSRLKPDGIYILDEPEAALSPMRCLSLVAMLKPLVESGRIQCLIATHSPVLMAFPGAELLYFDGDGIHKRKFADIPHVDFMKNFLACPERYLRHL